MWILEVRLYVKFFGTSNYLNIKDCLVLFLKLRLFLFIFFADVFLERISSLREAYMHIFDSITFVDFPSFLYWSSKLEHVSKNTHLTIDRDILLIGVRLENDVSVLDFMM